MRGLGCANGETLESSFSTIGVGTETEALLRIDSEAVSEKRGPFRRKGKRREEMTETSKAKRRAKVRTTLETRPIYYNPSSLLHVLRL